MKIVEGCLAGRQIQYKEQKGTRVTTDNVRKAVFDVLKNLIYIERAKVADLFCGSGMYGMEALSRGAGSVWFVDDNKKIVEQLKKNIKDIKILRYCDIEILNKKFENFIEQHGSKQEHGTGDLFDLVFADPPYYDFDFKKFNEVYKILNKGGVFVLEGSKRVNVGKLESLALLIEKNYGDTRVWFYKKI